MKGLTAAIVLLTWSSFPLAHLYSAPIDFTGLSETDVSDGDGQTFVWSSGPMIGTVILSADWSNLPDQGGPVRTATSFPATLSDPFVGSLTLLFNRPVQLTLAATFSSLLNDGQDGGRYERVTLSAPGPVTFHPLSGTTAVYTGIGAQSITADDTFSLNPTTSIWGFVGAGFSDTYTFVYTSTRVGFSETFNVEVTAVPEPDPLTCIGMVVMALTLSVRSRSFLRQPQG